MASCLNGCLIKSFKFSFEKNCKFTTSDKNELKGAEEYTDKKVPIIFGNRM